RVNDEAAAAPLLRLVAFSEAAVTEVAFRAGVVMATACTAAAVTVPEALMSVALHGPVRFKLATLSEAAVSALVFTAEAVSAPPIETLPPGKIVNCGRLPTTRL